MVVYFTGTGNSRYAAELLAEALDDEIRDSSGFIKNGIAAELISGKPWVFVAPVYAWSYPEVFGQFIRSGFFQGDGRAYFVLTCGGSMGAAWDRTEALCREVGLTHMGTYAAVMPENYVAMFSAPGAEKAREIIAKAEPGLFDLAEKHNKKVVFKFLLETAPQYIYDKYDLYFLEFVFVHVSTYNIQIHQLQLQLNNLKR